MNIKDIETVIKDFVKIKSIKKNDVKEDIQDIINKNNIEREVYSTNRLITFEHIVNRNNQNFADFNNKIISSLESDKWLEWHKEVLKQKEQNSFLGLNFNIFKLFQDKLGISIQETMHSKLIQFLLDENESHGQGNKFLIALLNQLNISNPTEGKWYVTAESGRIDVLLKRNNPHSVIIIENKSNWAVDQPNQLYRYWFHKIYKITKETGSEFYIQNKDIFQIVYLSPNENKNFNVQSITKPNSNRGLCDKKTFNLLPQKVPININHWSFNNEFQTWLDECIKSLPPSNYRVKEYLEQYKILTNNL